MKLSSSILTVLLTMSAVTSSARSAPASAEPKPVAARVKESDVSTSPVAIPSDEFAAPLERLESCRSELAARITVARSAQAMLPDDDRDVPRVVGNGEKHAVALLRQAGQDIRRMADEFEERDRNSWTRASDGSIRDMQARSDEFSVERKKRRQIQEKALEIVRHAEALAELQIRQMEEQRTTIAGLIPSVRQTSGPCSPSRGTVRSAGGVGGTPR